MDRSDEESSCVVNTIIDDWEHLEEGGMHLIFTNGTRILRIEKEWSSFSSFLALTGDNSTGCGSTIFHQLCHHLSPYTDIPMIRRLSRDDIMKLNSLLFKQQPQSYIIPVGADHQGDDKEYWTLALELPDYRQRNKRLLWSSNSTTSTTLSLEIKPKAGYTAISPLVNQDRLIKYRKTRFEIQQQLYESGMVRKRWMMNQDTHSTTPTKSWYNPLDMFSGETKRIRNAIQALFRCPQNNLKVWKQGSHRIMQSPYDNDESNRSVSLLRNAESVLFEGENDIHSEEAPPKDGEKEGGMRLLDIVATILCREPFLDKIHRFQKLDVIDADGAINIFERLVQTFCNGCVDTAEAMVNNVKWRRDIAASADVIHDVLRNAPLLHCDASSYDTGRIRQYCDHVLSLQNHAVNKLTSSSNQSFENARLAASRLLTEFQSNDCCYLLQCWLLSLAMCDLSFFVTLHRVHSITGTSRTDRLQTATSPGCIVYHNDYFEYELKCIDYDYKPAKKLRSRKERESLINDQLLT